MPPEHAPKLRQRRYRTPYRAQAKLLCPECNQPPASGQTPRKLCRFPLICCYQGQDGISNPKKMVALLRVLRERQDGISAASRQSGNFVLLMPIARRFIPICCIESATNRRRQISVPHHLFGYLDGVTPLLGPHDGEDSKMAIGQAHCRRCDTNIGGRQRLVYSHFA